MSNKEKLPCAAVRDLLPLHVEGLCSEETDGLMREHLEACGDCAAEGEAMRAKITASPAEHADDQSSLRAMHKTYRTVRIRTLLIAVCVALVLSLGTVALLMELARPIKPLTAQELDATTLYLAEDGRVYCYLNTNRYIFHSSPISRIHADPRTQTVYLSMDRPRWPFAVRTGRDGNPPQYPQTMLTRSYTLGLSEAKMTDGRMIALARTGIDTYEEMEIKLIMVGNDQDGFEAIWQAGDSIAPLPEEIMEDE